MSNNKQTAMLIIGPQTETIKEARDALMSFVLADAPADVIIKALDVFKNIVSINNVSISGCSFTNEV